MDSTPLQPSGLDQALAILAGDPCLAIGADLAALCRAMELQPAGGGLTAPATWLCEHGEFFTLIRREPDTLLFCHRNQMLYFAAPDAQLAQRCPDGEAFLCQFTHDGVGAAGPERAQSVPRLLAFDVLGPGDAGERGERLRTLGAHLPQPLCCVQWVGEPQCLTRAFLGGLPHAASGVFGLGPRPGFVTCGYTI
jgi:hypothetical protein